MGAYLKVSGETLRVDNFVKIFLLNVSGSLTL